MIPKYLAISLILCVRSVLSHESGHGNYGVKGGPQGIKSYGGYSNSPSSSSFIHSPTYHQQLQQTPFYQPYGWNFNQQPQRTYGGVIQQNYPGNPQGFGWFGAGNQFGNQFPGSNDNNNDGPTAFPKAPQMPSLFMPNFVPPVYFPTAQYPTFQNFPNLFPYGNNDRQYPGQNQNGGGGGFQRPVNPNGDDQRPVNPNDGGQHNHGDDQFQRPLNPNGGGSQGHHHHHHNHDFHGHNHNSGNEFDSHNQQGGNRDRQPPQVVPIKPTQRPVVSPNIDNQDNHVDSDDQFLTNAFFGHNADGTDKVNRQWTQDDEQKWQATTKAPYFENKVPGLECTLPASAVLGATTALKASSLLPLQVPIGKPILSCNATELLQAQINLNGVIYDCLRNAITMSCPRVDANGVIQDECHGETLECDVRMRQNSRSVSCTNGTLISNHPIVCKSATLMPSKNVLNCLYKSGIAGDSASTHVPRIPPVNVPRLPSPASQTTVRPSAITPRPAAIPNTSILPPPVAEDGSEEIQDFYGLDVRGANDNKYPLPSLGLTQDVKTAMKGVFPLDLLSAASTNVMYLPPKAADSGRIPNDLKEELNGVFPYNLFAFSQNDEHESSGSTADNKLGLSSIREENKKIENLAIFSQNRQSEWNVDVNRKSGNPGTSIKTQPSHLTQRFGGVTEANDEDRLIFSP